MMATGYIHPVADGDITTVRQFAIKCAWGMMALVTLRDDDHSKDPPRQLEPNLGYCTERLIKAQARLDMLATMTDAEREAMLDKEHAEALVSAQEYDRKAAVEIDRVEAMQRRVHAAAVVFPDGLREFMQSQLADAVDRTPYTATAYVQRPTFEAAWSRAVEDVGKAHAGIEREKALTKSRNAWLTQFWAAIDLLDTSEGTPE